MSHDTMLSKYCNWDMHLLKIKNKLKNLLFLKIKSGRAPDILWAFFYKTIIPLVLVGYEMFIANSVLCALLAIYHLISNEHLWNNC